MIRGLPLLLLLGCAGRSVFEYGARGDGTTDDTEAIRAAIRDGGVIRFPRGRYVVTGVLAIENSGTVLQGDGATIFCPKPLAEILGPSKSWSWSGGILWARATGAEELLATLSQSAVEGSSTVVVADASRIRAGDAVRLAMEDGDTLAEHLYGSKVAVREKIRIRWPVRVESVEGNVVRFREPLRLDARLEWSPRILSMPRIERVGIEGLRIEFPLTKYPGHLNELGYNAIAFDSVVDGWIRDVEIVNADSGIFVGGSKQCTIRDVRIVGDRGMHHALCASASADCLFERWEILAPHVHGTTVSWGACGNVFRHGRGRLLAMDAHRSWPYQNVHDDITILHEDRAPDPLRSGGDASRGPHAARGNVYRNIRFVFEKPGPPVRFGPYAEWPGCVFEGWHGDREIDFRGVPGQTIGPMNRRVP